MLNQITSGKMIKPTLTEQAATLQAISQKSILTLTEASLFLGLSKSYLYKLTASAQIPHYKPNGKMVYFDRAEVEAWALSNRVSTTAEATQRAVSYCQNH